MWGPNEFIATGTYKGYDATNRLSELVVRTLFLCGRHDLARPEETFWYHGLVPGAELVVFLHSSYVPHLEEPQRYLQVLRDFLHPAEEATSRKPGSARSRRLRDGPVASLVHIGWKPPGPAVLTGKPGQGGRRSDRWCPLPTDVGTAH